MATCPSCRASSRVDPEVMVIEPVLVARDAGTWSLAGLTLKVSASEQLQLRCTACGFAVTGFIEGDAFVATPDAVKAALGRLDGSTAAAVELLTGAPRTELDQLGGFGGPPARNVCPQCGGYVRRWYADQDGEGDVAPRADCTTPTCDWGF